jgi:hypothetical protein
MEKDVSVKPAAKKQTASESGKKDTRKIRTTTKTAARGKRKSSRTKKSTVKAGTVSKAASPKKKQPAARTRVAKKPETPPESARKKPAPRPKTEKETKPPKPPAPPARIEDTNADLKTTGQEPPGDPTKTAGTLTPPAAYKSDEIHPPADETLPPDPLKKIILFFSIGLIILIGLMLFASYQNMKKYFITSQDGAVEIWKGKFSPKGRNRIVIMPGLQPPEQIKSAYAREEVFPLVVQYYIGKADALMEVPGMPDFAGIKSYLNRALYYATTDTLRSAAKSRINSIDRMILLFKADAAASKATLAGLEAAVKYLDQASAHDPDEIEKKLIRQKLESIEKLKEILSPQTDRSKSVKGKLEKRPLKKQ